MLYYTTQWKAKEQFLFNLIIYQITFFSSDFPYKQLSSMKNEKFGAYGMCCALPVTLNTIYNPIMYTTSFSPSDNLIMPTCIHNLIEIHKEIIV